MIRLLFTIAAWVFILGGLFVYSRTRHWIEPSREPAIRIQPLPGEFAVEVTPTYGLEASVDDFAADIAPKPSIVLTLNAEEIVRHEEPAAAGIPVVFRWNTNEVPVNVGRNEFYVAASPPDETFGGAPAVRLRLLRDGAPIAEQTLWAEPRRGVEGAMFLEFPPHLAGEPRHEH